MRKLTLITLIIMLNSQAWAAATPQASRYDARIQQVIYNPQNVTVVNTKPGFMTTLVLITMKLLSVPVLALMKHGKPEQMQTGLTFVLLRSHRAHQVKTVIQHRLLSRRTAVTGIPIC